MRMGNSGHERCARWGWAVLLLTAAVLVLIGSGSGMRETDQASIISGALDLAWGGELVGNGAYRYDKFYGTYWLLALWYDMFGISLGDDPDRVVGLGNALASLLYVFGLALLLWKERFSLWTGLVALVALLSPVLVLSAPLLSPNIFSIGFLFIVGFLLKSGRESWWLMLGVGMAAFMAVACRMDAVFMMPLLCWASERVSVWKLWKSRKCVALFVGSVAAVLVSKLVGIGHGGGIGESFFFMPKVAAAYLVFGLWSSLAMLLVFAAWLVSLKKLRYLLLGLALVLPLAFYLGLLFSPRHLALVPVGILLSLLLPRGRRLWSVFLAKKLSKVVVTVCAASAFVGLFTGLKMPAKNEVKLSFTGKVTVYPTCDGYWPMGGLVQFLDRLSDSAVEPVDYNQQVWAAWSGYEFKDDELVSWDRLFRYPELSAKLQGKSFDYVTEPKHGAVFSGRSYTKGDVSLGEYQSQEVLSTQGASIYQMSQRGGKKSIGAVIEMLMGDNFAEENDYLLCASKDELLARTRFLYGNEVFLFSVEKKDTNKHDFLGLYEGLYTYKAIWTEKMHIEIQGSDRVWVAVFYLPSYMKVKAYESERE